VDKPKIRTTIDDIELIDSDMVTLNDSLNDSDILAFIKKYIRVEEDLKELALTKSRDNMKVIRTRIGN